MRDEFLFQPSQFFDYLQEGFRQATRVELHILSAGGLACEIEFFKGGQSTGHRIVFSVQGDGRFGSGFLA